MAIVFLPASVDLLAGENSLPLRPVLSLEIAINMARACELKQQREQANPVSIAIVDDGGNLLLFHRMTGASLGSTVVTMEKAKSAAHFPVSTRQWQEYVAAHPEASNIELLPNILTIPGGVPVLARGNVHLGGIGVSGSSSDEDEACAMAGLDAVKDMLQ